MKSHSIRCVFFFRVLVAFHSSFDMCSSECYNSIVGMCLHVCRHFKSEVDENMHTIQQILRIIHQIRSRNIYTHMKVSVSGIILVCSFINNLSWNERARVILFERLCFGYLQHENHDNWKKHTFLATRETKICGSVCVYGSTRSGTDWYWNGGLNRVRLQFISPSFDVQHSSTRLNWIIIALQLDFYCRTKRNFVCISAAMSWPPNQNNKTY